MTTSRTQNAKKGARLATSEAMPAKRSKKPTRVADVLIELRKVDPKRNRFTVAITADDKTVEKKDRTLNEPIQFYTLKARQPDEIVINQVRKDAIVGYLSTPKVQNGRGAGTQSSNGASATGTSGTGSGF